MLREFWMQTVAGTIRTGMIAVISVFVFLAVAQGQSGFDTPQTTLTPIDGLYSPQGPSGFQGGFGSPASGFGNANSAPRIRLGTAGAPFDPYSASTPTGAFAPSGYPTAPMMSPSLNGPVYNNSPYGQAVSPPPFGGLFGGTSNGSVFSNGNSQAPPVFGSGGMLGNGTGLGGSGFGSSIYPQTGIPSGSPSTLFPGGLFGTSYGGNSWGDGSSNTAFRPVQGLRARHTYIFGGTSDDDLSTNDTDVSLPFAWQNFLGSTRPLFIVPSFSVHLWDGPNSSTGADLPGSAYSAFLDFGWQTDPNQMFGLELGARVGSFAEFGVWDSDSLRLMGKGLASFRLTPFSTIKGGVYYLDRNRYKLLPAGGLLWQPNPYTRFDIFFPQPKIARYWRTVGTHDVWGYLSGDIGGGNWAVQRDNGLEDSVDINDIRVMAGLEWGLTDLIRAGRRTGFLEVGYVFDREIRYDKTFVTGNNKIFKPDDGFLIRLGIGY
ncbi:MAG: hypothetical protein WBD20_03210 [Pirellulaceae bacterium]